MKRLLRILLPLILILALALSAGAAETGEADRPLPAASESDGDAPSDGAGEESLPDNPLPDLFPDGEETPDGAGDAPETDTDKPGETPDPSGGTPSGSDGTADDTVGARLARLVSRYAGELLALLTLTVSLWNAYRYKRGLLPVLWNGMRDLNQSGVQTGNALREIAQDSRADMAAFRAEAEPILARLNTLCEGSERLAAQAADLETRIAEGEADRAAVRTWMAGVGDMLYTVFTAANLPAYAKERLGVCYNALNVSPEAHHDAGETSPVV